MPGKRPASPSTGGGGYQALRKKLDEMGYYQSLLPESVPLVEALFNDLLATTHNLKACKEQLNQLGPERKRRQEEEEIEEEEEEEEERLPKLEQLDNEKKLEYEKKIYDLQLLSSQALAMVKKLQEESYEKSQKILKLESATIGPKVIVKNKAKRQHVCGPKMELKSFVPEERSSSLSSSSSPSEKKQPQPPPDLDIIEMYDRKNKQLTEEILKLEKALEESKQRIRNLELELSHHHSRLCTYATTEEEEEDSTSSSSEQQKQSAYVMKLLKENASLKEKLSSIEQHGRICEVHGMKTVVGGGGGHPPPPHCHYMHHHHHPHYRSCEDLRTDITDIQTKDIESSKLKHHPEWCQPERVQVLQDELRKAREEIKELKRRVENLTVTKTNLKDKIQVLKSQRKILMKDSCESGKVQDLIGFMEKQRDIYRHNVEELLHKLDMSNGTEEEEEEEIKKKKRILVSTSRPVRVQQIKEQDENIRRELEDEIQELKTKLRSLASERSELRNENEELKTKLRDCENSLAVLELRLSEAKKSAAEEAESRVIQRTTDDVELSSELRRLRNKILNLEEELNLKNSHLRKMSDEKDELIGTLDAKTVELETLKSKFSKVKSDSERVECDKMIQEKRISQSLQELHRLQTSLKDAEVRLSELSTKLEAERSVGKELRTENHTLKTQIRELEAKRDQSQAQISEIKSHIQRYVNEVKRIEELLSVCEKERCELLEQYKHLSLEVNTAETYGRKLEAQVENLKMELKSKETELKSTEIRLANMEKELAETSLSNENYRTEIAALSAKLDVAQSELKEARSQQSWINSDLTNVHELAVQLNSQKVELLNKISEQDQEISAMSEEIRHLRNEMARIEEKYHDDKMKSFENEDNDDLQRP